MITDGDVLGPIELAGLPLIGSATAATLLRVPPTTRTAREAVAWTFGFNDPAEYLLAAES